MFVTKSVRTLRTMVLAGAVALGATACDSIFGPGGDGNIEDSLQLLHDISLSEFEEFLTEGQARVELHVDDEGLVAREVSVASSDELTKEEEIESHITAISNTITSGTLTLSLGGVQIDYDNETAFLSKSEDEISHEEFAARVNGALAEGEHLPVRIRRIAPANPQDSSDPTFVAHAIRLLAELDGSNIDMNLGVANFVANASPPPDGWIELLGLRVAINASGGVTEIHVEGKDADGEEAAFEGHVKSVNLDAGSFTLDNGTVVRLEDETTIKSAVGYLRSLGAVAEVLESGRSVVAWGEGVVEGKEPLRIAAMYAAFKAHEENGAVEDFEGVVASINLDAGSVTLDNGIVVRIGEETQIKDHEEYLPSLEAVALALEAGEAVAAWGEGAVEGEGPLTILAFHVAFLIRVEPVPADDFEGAVASIDLQAMEVVLENGTVIILDEESTVKDYEGYLPSLDAAAQALADGNTVVAWGEGSIEGENPLTLRAYWIKFQAQVPTTGFEDTVASVDLQENTVTLSDGTVVRVTGETTIKEIGDLHTLDAVATALTENKTVLAVGEAEIEAEGPPATLEAFHVKFIVEGS